VRTARDWRLMSTVVAAAMLGGALAQLLAAGAVARAQEPAGPGELRAPAFVAVDEEGRPRLRLGPLKDPAGWGLRLYDESAVNRATVALWDNGVAGIRVYDARARTRSGYGASADGLNVGLALVDPDGNERLGLGMGPSGGCDFALKDYAGEPTWRASWCTAGPPAEESAEE
jgi:hypothetical protein